MSKKQKRPSYRIEFKGTDIVLENVKLIQLPHRLNGLPFTRIDKHSSGLWMLTHVAGGLFDEIPEEGIELVIDRKGENIYLHTADDDGCGITRRVTKATRLNVNAPVFHLDCLEFVTHLRSNWRLTYSSGFIAETPAIKSIRITSMGD